MKALKSILILTCILFSSQTYSQIYIQDLNLNQVEGITYIEVYISGKFRNIGHALDYNISIDYGAIPTKNQLGTKAPNATILDKPGGEIIDFKSKMHVVNYFENNGWSLWDINSEAQGDVGARTSYYFKKK